jgi:hypothetical protein
MIADEHPEELLDRAIQGSLAPEQQATLDRHLAGCPVCAGQLSLAPRFERELAPQARDHVLYQRAVEGAMRRLHESPAGWRRRKLPPWLGWAAAAGFLIVAVTAAGAVIGRRMALRARVTTPAAPVEPHPMTAPIRPVGPAPSEAPPPAEAPGPRTTPSAHGAARPAVTAAELFERGEKLRREGHADAAIATYRRLQATFPETAEARLSFAFGGELLLKKGRPADALVQFDRHLSLDGEVGEEALAGRATALEQLHRTSEAAAAWKSLLARYPRSVYAERARARLDELNRRP